MTSTVEDITLTNGAGDERCTSAQFEDPFLSGGGLCVVADVELLAERLTLTGNAAQFGAGAVLLDGTITMNDVQINNNVAEFSGGGIFVIDDADLTIDGGVVSNNTAVEDGGGLFVFGDVQATVIGVQITDNVVDTYGGGIAIRDVLEPMRVIDTLIARNSAEEGGGIDLEGGSVALVDSLLLENTVTNTGAAIAMVGGETTLGPIVVCEADLKAEAGFHGNQAPEGGVAVSVDTGVFFALGCDFGEPDTASNNVPADVRGLEEDLGDDVASLSCHESGSCSTADVFRLRTAQSDDLCLNASRRNGPPSMAKRSSTTVIRMWTSSSGSQPHSTTRSRTLRTRSGSTVPVLRGTKERRAARRTGMHSWRNAARRRVSNGSS